MADVVIIKEDTGAGKMLFDKVNTALYGNKLFVTSTGQSPHTGGNYGFLKKVDELIAQRVISKGTVVFLAIDNIVTLNFEATFGQKYTAAMVAQNIQNFTKFRDMIQQCETNTKAAQAFLVKSTYACIEEAILSYQQLWQLTSPLKPYKYTTYENELLQLYKSLSPQAHEMLTGTTQPLNTFYVRILQRIMQKYHKTAETVLSNLLNIISKRNFSTLFEINKAAIGQCWYMDCPAVCSQNPHVKCKDCVVHTQESYAPLQSGKNKLQSLVSKSRLNNIFEDIKQGKQLLALQNTSNKQPQQPHYIQKGRR